MPRKVFALVMTTLALGAATLAGCGGGDGGGGGGGETTTEEDGGGY